MAHSFQFFFRPVKAFSLKYYLEWKTNFNQYTPGTFFKNKITSLLLENFDVVM